MLTDALSLRLSAFPDLVLVGRYGTSDPDLVRDVASLRPDVVVIDIEPAGSAAGELVEELLLRWPAAHIVVLTGCTDVEVAVQVARAGAAAWVGKENTLEFLIQVMRGVCRNCAWWPPDQLGAVLRALRAGADPHGEQPSPLESLSRREREVLLGLSAGEPPQVIARDLSISVNTVRTHTGNIFAKLGVHSRLAAAKVVAAADLQAALAGDVSRSDAVVQLIHRHDSPPPVDP
jgi:DNA-binding NarL/FixJ family response regulator